MSETENKVVEKCEDVTNVDVLNKYKSAADVANAAIAFAKALCIPGASIHEVTSRTDAHILELLKSKYSRKKDITKGVGFPTCVSVNALVGHVAPSASSNAKIAEGDVVKIDLGVHIDGFLAVVATTFVAQTTPAVVTGTTADLIVAADKAAQLAGRLLKSGATNGAITEAIAAIAADYGVTPVLGVLSHNIARFTIDGEKTILNCADAEHRSKDCTFEKGEVYALDIVMSTGTGKPRKADESTTIYKRTTIRPNLRSAASRHLLHEANTSFPHFPFSLNACSTKQARLGAVECERTGALEPLPVLTERKGCLVAQSKVTCVLLPSGATQIITGLSPSEADVKSEKTVSNAEFAALLAAPVEGGKKAEAEQKASE